MLNAVTRKTPCEYNEKEVSAYVLSLFVSEDRNLCRLANSINEFHFTMPDKAIYKFYREMIPAGPRYLRFTKKTKEAKDKDEQIQELMKTHGISRREASLSL